MPKNVKGGNKTKSQKNSSGPAKNREIAVPETSDDSHVASITKVNGDSRYTVDILGSTGIQKSGIIAHMSSTVKKKYGGGIILKPGNYVLVSIRPTDGGRKADIIFLYRDTEIEYLVDNGHISKIISYGEDSEYSDCFKNTQSSTDISSKDAKMSNTLSSNISSTLSSSSASSSASLNGLIVSNIKDDEIFDFDAI